MNVMTEIISLMFLGTKIPKEFMACAEGKNKSLILTTLSMT